MRFATPALVSLASLPALARAHDILVNARHVEHARQAATAPAVAAPAAAASSTASFSSFPPVSVSLQSTNPTAIPLSSIIAGAPTQATHALDQPATPGATPTNIPGAPALPNVVINPASYPALDKVPPTDSPEVLQWIQDVQNSGVTIPTFNATNAGGCPNNTAALADDSERCWWTCGGCTRPNDVTTCPDKLTWGLTFDDGPSPYTPDLLNFLDSQNLHATFFVVGSRVISYPSTLQSEYMSGHEIAVHTWSHPSLTTLSNEQIIAELGWSKKAIKDVLGVTPSMMRPPFGDIDDRVRAICTAMGLTPVMWTRLSPSATFDTDDFDIAGGLTGVGQVLQNWEDIVGNVSIINTGFIVLEHDLFQQSVDVATGYILPDALAHNPPFTIKPVVQCLNKPDKDAYIETNDNKTSPPAGSGPVTLSSGAPGSAQATGASGHTSTGSASTMSGSSTLVSLLLVTVTGLLGALLL